MAEHYGQASPHTMRIQHFVVITAVVLAALFAISCSKNASEPTAQTTNLRQVLALPADMPKADLGVVEFSPQTPKRISLGAGKECVITPTVLADGNLRMDLAIETKTADGKAQRLEQSRLIARPGQQCAISVGETMIVLTPTLKTQ